MSLYKTCKRIALGVVLLFALAIPLPAKRMVTGLASGSVLGTALIINEVDSDQAGNDSAEFIELYDGGGGNSPLDGYVVVFYNGANDLSYAAFDLDGFTTNANGYFTLGNAAVPGVDLTFSNGSLQNGPDAVAIFSANASDFPNMTPLTTTNLRDAIVYSNTATIDAGLLVLLNAGQLQINENSGGTGMTVSMQRMPNGSGGERNTASYQVLPPSPDGPNAGPTVAAVSLGGRVTDASGQGIRDVRIRLEGGMMSEPRGTIASSFGYYSFDGLAPGIYMVTVNSKRHSFASPTRVITITDNVTDFDFVAEPQE